jgi:hypothetical protein
MRFTYAIILATKSRFGNWNCIWVAHDIEIYREYPRDLREKEKIERISDACQPIYDGGRREEVV